MPAPRWRWRGLPSTQVLHHYPRQRTLLPQAVDLPPHGCSRLRKGDSYRSSWLPAEHDIPRSSGTCSPARSMLPSMPRRTVPAYPPNFLRHRCAEREPAPAAGLRDKMPHVSDIFSACHAQSRRHSAPARLQAGTARGYRSFPPREWKPEGMLSIHHQDRTCAAT